MRHLVLLLLLLCSFLSATFAQNSEDCVDAHVLAPTATLLSDIPDITIDELIGSGNEPAEWFNDNEDQCGPQKVFISQPTDKAYWFVFSAETTGNLEFMITPEAPGTTYDFALWRGGCPNDTNCSELHYCAWGVGSFECGVYLPTGVSTDPLGTFNTDPSTNLTIYLENIPLQAGENYYLLIQNTDEASNLLCPEGVSDSLGFTIQFDGDAIIGPEIIHEAPTAILPTPNTTILSQCTGNQVTFAVSQVPNAATYDWISKSTMDDAVIMPNALGDSATVIFGINSGQICMELICPIQSTICWEIQVEQAPDLVVIPNATNSCEPVDLATRFQDNNNINGTIAYYETAEDAMNGINPLVSSIVNIDGNYWVRKTTPSGCSDIIQITILINNIAIEVVDTLSVCSQTFVNLRDELSIQSLNGNTEDLVFVFYEDSLDAVNRTNFITPPVVFTNGTYWVRAENQSSGPCFDLKSFELIFDTPPTIAPIPTQELCNSACFQLLDLPLNTVDGSPISNFALTFYDNEADGITGNIDNAINTEICSDGTYWARVSSSASCFAVESFTLNFSAAPDIDDVTLTIDCNFGCINLAELILTEKNGINQADLSYSFFATEAAATALNATPLTSAELLICTPSEIWIKVTNQRNNCFDVAKVSIEGMPLATAALTGSQTICAGGAGALDISFTGDAPFNLRYTDGVRFFDTIATSNNFLLLVTPNSTRTYSIFSFMDFNGCVGNASGAATITVNEAPTINILTQDCNADNTDYILSFEIIGNDIYTVQGVDGTLTGNVFTSSPISSGASSVIEITGADGCPITQNTTFSCACNAVVDIMDTQAINICDREAAIGTYLGPGGENLDGGTRFFVLHDSPTTTLGTIVAYDAVPIFTFDASIMQHGVTYYLSAIITNTDLLGEPILDIANNSCLVASIGAPVTFYPVPEASLSLSAPTICQGESVNLTFNINGVGPYDVIFFDGAGLRSLTDIPNGHTISLTPEFSTNFHIQSVSQRSVNNCRNTPLITNNQIDLTVFEVPIIQNVNIHCNEKGDRLALTFEVIGGDLATYTVNGITGTFKGNEFTSDSIPHNTPYEISVSTINNCPSLPIIGVAECFCTSDIAVEISTIKSASCRGDKDAILSAIPINGAAPYTYFWSTGATTQNASNIAPGMTAVSVTDANGCLVTNSINLIEPSSITASVNTLAPSCFGDTDGLILFVQVEGGTGVYNYSFNNSPFREEGQRAGLGAGVYPLAIRDENGCQWSGETTLNNPSQLAVSLGDNKALNLGDSLALNPQINDTEITIEWESDDAAICPDCPNPIVKPSSSQRYKITVTNTAGCIATDQVLVQVQNQQRLYVPTAFSPNGDGANDILHPFMGSEIQDIPMFRVFNRWGELVYENTDMSQSSNFEGWDGTTLTGRKAPPGVYIYYAEINFRNRTTDVRTGDLTLIR